MEIICKVYLNNYLSVRKLSMKAKPINGMLCFFASLVMVIQRMYVFTFNICQVVCRCRTLQAVDLTPLKEGFQMVLSRR